jgi:hypothetical protein
VDGNGRPKGFIVGACDSEEGSKLNVDNLLDTYFPRAAVSIAALCVIAVLLIAVVTKRRTGKYPQELTTANGRTPMPTAQALWIGFCAGWLQLWHLADIPALKTPLAFFVPGADIAFVIAMVAYQLSVVWERAFSLKLALALAGRMVIVAAVGFFLLIGARHVVSGISPLAVWSVAIAEACIFVPFAAWLMGYAGQRAGTGRPVTLLRRES